MSRRTPPFQPNEIIATLVRHEVAFVIIGGIAAVLQGVPYTTFDFDIVYSRDAKNMDRIDAALNDLDATLFELSDRQLRPTRSLLSLPGPKLLRTRYGRLDLLGELDEETTWDALIQRSVELPFGAHRVHVLSLATVIEVKERLGRDKDKAALPLLRATLARQGR